MHGPEIFLLEHVHTFTSREAEHGKIVLNHEKVFLIVRRDMLLAKYQE